MIDGAIDVLVGKQVVTAAKGDLAVVAPYGMHAFANASGDEVEHCGNGARCVVRLAWERGEVVSPLGLETDVGTHAAAVLPRPAGPPWVEIDMGMPRWDGASLPL